MEELVMSKDTNVYSESQNPTNTPIHFAVMNCEIETVKGIIKRGAHVNATNVYGETALHLAIQERHEDIVQILVDHGADVKLKIRTGETPLHFAARVGLEETCRLLLERGADVHAQNLNGQMALHLAILGGHKDIVQSLVDQGADVNLKTLLNETPLHFAVRRGREEICNLLIERGADVNARNIYGETGLQLAIKERHEFPSIQQLLIKMQIANLDVNNGNVENFNITTNMNEQSLKFQKKCIEEIMRMKNTIINDTILTFHDILTKRVDQLALYARNENVVQVLKRSNYRREFPIYKDIMERRFNRGIVQKELLDEGVTFFRRFLGRCYDLLCIERILKYLNNRDLMNLRDVYKNVCPNINDAAKRETL